MLCVLNKYLEHVMVLFALTGLADSFLFIFLEFGFNIIYKSF